MKGGFTIVFGLFFELVNAAIIKFQQEVTDNKAMILPTFNTVSDVVRLPVPIHHLSLTPRVPWAAFLRGVIFLRWA